MGAVKEKHLNNVEWEENDDQRDIREVDSDNGVNAIDKRILERREDGYLQQFRCSNPTTYKDKERV